VSAALSLPELPEKVADVRPAHSRLNDVVAYGVSGLLLLCPLVFGAVEPWAVFVLESISAVLFAVWIIGQMRNSQIKILGAPIFTPMLAFAGVALVQLAFGLSAYGHATFKAVLLYVAYGLICFLITQTLTRTRQLRRIATAVVIYGTGLAMFAILQGLSSPGKLYWFRTLQQGGWIYGPYVNHNHYAGLMEMLVPVALVFAFSRYARGRERWAAASAAALMGATIFLSGSRGGMAAFAVELGVLLYFLFRERRNEGTGLLLGGFLLLSLATVAWIGGSKVSARIATLDGDHRTELTGDIRLSIDRDTVAMFAKRPILGWGLGTFEQVYPQFRSFYTSLFVDKAHNDYLQLAAETGLLGFGAAIWFLWSTLRSAWHKSNKWASDINGGVSVAAIVGITGILVHSLVDFNLQIPANAALFYALCTMAAMTPRFTSHRRERNRALHREVNTDLRTSS
jgi:O-antigen ligase